jgi:hypothetical protein
MKSKAFSSLIKDSIFGVEGTKNVVINKKGKKGEERRGKRNEEEVKEE